jgi:DNA-binding NarL/FixJ family response regulator
MSKVLFAEDHSIVIRGMKVLFETSFSAFELDVVVNISDMMSRLHKHNYVMAIIDLQLEDADTLHLIPDIRNLYPDLNIVIFSGNPEEPYAYKLYQQGVKGYVTKHSTDAEIIDAFNQVLAGKIYMSENFKHYLLKSQRSASDSPFTKLSQRELEVLKLMVQGKRSSEICRELNLQASTVATYKGKIFTKLSIGNVLELKKLVNHYRLL